MKLIIKKGTTSKRVGIFVQDSSLTTGAGLAGLVFNSASLTWHYWREDQGNVGATSVTLATATRGTWATGGFIEKDATGMPGMYEIGIPDAVLATGANWAIMTLKGATNMAVVTIEIQLTDFDPNDAVRAGLTALPNAAAEAAGGLYTRGTGAGQIAQSTNGQIDVDTKKINAVSAASVATINAHIGTTAASTAQTGDSFARLGAPAGASVSADIAAVNTKTTNLPTDPADQSLIIAATDAIMTRLGTPAGASVSVDIAAVKTETASIQGDTNDIQARLPAALVSGRIDASVGAVAANAITAAAIATDAFTAAKFAADAKTKLRSIVSGTAQSGSTTTLVDTARTEADTDYWKGCILLVTSGSSAGEARLITGFNAATDALTFAPALTQAISTNTYEILPGARADVGLWNGALPNVLLSGRVDASVGDYPGNTPQTGDSFARLGAPAGASVSADVAAVNAKTTNLPSDPADQSLIIAATDAIMTRLGTPAGASVSVDVAAVKAETASIQADTNDIQTRLPAALVSGRIDASVGAMAAAVVTAAAIAADAITAAKVASDVSDEIAAKILVTPAQKVVTDVSGFVTANLNGDLTATMKTSVNAEVVDALAVDTYAEPSAPPAATATLKDKVGWMAALSRNKITQTATTQLLRNDGDAATIGTSTHSDDATTHIRGKFA